MTYVMCFVFLALVGGYLGFCVFCGFPEVGVLWLVLCFVLGCFVVGVGGESFVALVVFVVYVGGMMVVFAYAVVVTGDVDSGFGWGGGQLLCCYLGLVACLFLLVDVGFYLFRFGLLGVGDQAILGGGDFDGVSLLYLEGGFYLLVCGWSLFLVLFVVLELVRGGFRGALRAV